MRIKEVTALIAQKVMEERERCAKICDAVADDPHGSNPECAAAEFLASEIRSAPAPVFTVVRPETVAADPSKMTEHTIMAGQALVGDEIVDRYRYPKRSCLDDLMSIQGEGLGVKH